MIHGLGVEALGRAFSVGATILNDHVMEHFMVADRPVNRARLAALVTKDLETFTLDLRGVSDSCGRRPTRWRRPRDLHRHVVCHHRPP